MKTSESQEYMAPVGRPHVGSKGMSVNLLPSQVTKIDQWWMANHVSAPNRSAALREIVDLFFAGNRKAK